MNIQVELQWANSVCLVRCDAIGIIAGGRSPIKLCIYKAEARIYYASYCSSYSLAERKLSSRSQFKPAVYQMFDPAPKRSKDNLNSLSTPHRKI